MFLYGPNVKIREYTLPEVLKFPLLWLIINNRPSVRNIRPA